MMKFENLLVIPILALSASTMSATDYLVCDFEDFEIGQTLKVWNNFGDPTTTTAVVEKDPKNANNKVLHVSNHNWNDHIEFELPAEFAGTKFSDQIETLSVKICRHQNDPCGEWKNFQIFLGEDKLYEESWPSYGAVSTWKTWNYNPSRVSANNESPYLRIGFNSENSDYYIDDVRIQGPDFNTSVDGNLNFSDPASTSSKYTNYSYGIYIPEGKALNVYTSRYTYWTSPIKGSGTLNIHSGGERSYIGNNSGLLPDWSGFSGEVNFYPWPDVNPGVKAAFYGKILAHGGVKYDAGNAKNSIKEGRYSTLLAKNKVVIHDGATIAGEDGNNARAHRFGSLRMEPNSQLMGYYKANKTKGVYYLIGIDGTDSELAGNIVAQGTSMVGLVKEGEGTYSISGNNNRITGIVTVVGGKILISNDAKEAQDKKLPGAIGIGENNVGVIVYAGGCLGGSGNISGMSDVYGYLEPGDTKGNTLTIADFVKGNPCDLKLHPTSRLIFNLSDSQHATRLDVSGEVILNPRDEAYDLSGGMPILEIKLAENANLKKGDSFTLISAAKKNTSEADNWRFRVQYPNAYTWEVKENETPDGYEIVATVISEEYSGQGDTILDDIKVTDGDNSDFIVDWSSDYDDPNPLRHYAEKANKSIGVAIPSWNIDITSMSDLKTATIAQEFNLAESENAMKIDATEPSRGSFDLGLPRQQLDFSEKNSIDMRGHTLVWHSQVPAWISKDGKKNDHNWTKDQLTEIMQNHINGVAGGLKGRIREWDVVNECLDDDQSGVWSDPSAFKLRPSVWKDVIGEDFIEKAFRMAHEADPDALLFINDYDVEFMGEPKAEAYYNLVKSLVEKGTPIHGVGLQCHLTSGQSNAQKLKDNIHRYQQLGLQCAITELDIAQADPNAENAAKLQAEDYCALVMAALSEENCHSVVIWGLCDPDSWRENNPLLFDGNIKPKEAYYAVHAALRSVADSNNVEELEGDAFAKDIVSVDYYNLQGCKVGNDVKGLLVKVIKYADGSSESVKVMISE